MAVSGQTVRQVRELLRQLYVFAENGPGVSSYAATELDRFCRVFEEENGCELFLEDLHPDLDKLITDGEIQPVDVGLREACIALDGTVAEWYLQTNPAVVHVAETLPYALDDWGRRR